MLTDLTRITEFNPDPALLRHLETCDIEQLELPQDLNGALSLFRHVEAFADAQKSKRGLKRSDKRRTARLLKIVGQNWYRVQQSGGKPIVFDANTQVAMKQTSQPTRAQIDRERAALMA